MVYPTDNDPVQRNPIYFKGNLDYSFPIDRKDEFGELALEINRMLRRIKQLIYDLRETEEKKRRADFQVLLSQINPHFLYNTLNTIDMLIDFGDKRELHQVMLVLTRLLKYGLDRSTDLRPLREELHNISDYLYILSVRYGNRFTFEVADPGELAEVPVLKLVLQPIVENAVFHGIHPLVDRPGKLAVSVISQGNDIEIRIADNGVGMTPEKMAEIKQLLKEEGTGKGQSIGLFNVHKRIQLYYGMNYGLHIEPGITVGTTVIVKLNILMGMEEKRDVGTNPSADR